MRSQTPTSTLAQAASVPDAPLPQPPTSSASIPAASSQRSPRISNSDPTVVEIGQTRPLDATPPTASHTSPVVVEVAPLRYPDVDPPTALHTSPVTQSRPPDADPPTAPPPLAGRRGASARVSKPPKTKRRPSENAKTKVRAIHRRAASARIGSVKNQFIFHRIIANSVLPIVLCLRRIGLRRRRSRSAMSERRATRFEPSPHHARLVEKEFCLGWGCMVVLVRQSLGEAWLG